MSAIMPLATFSQDVSGRMPPDTLPCHRPLSSVYVQGVGRDRRTLWRLKVEELQRRGGLERTLEVPQLAIDLVRTPHQHARSPAAIGAKAHLGNDSLVRQSPADSKRNIHRTRLPARTLLDSSIRQRDLNAHPRLGCQGVRKKVSALYELKLARED
jgi:hypothetical protein